MKFSAACEIAYMQQRKGFPVNWAQYLLGIPVKVNIVSGGKPNGIPERR
jgi:hypothetical protein